MRSRLFSMMQTHVYRFRSEPFTLASGLQSQHYFNCKKITLVPERLWLLSALIVEEMLPALGWPQAVGGLTLGADPLAYGITLYAEAKSKHKILPLVVRKEEKGHGMKSRIEGELEGLSEVLVLDDVVTTGGSTLQAVAALRNAGLKVSQALAILDREEGGREALEREGVQLHAVFKKSEFF